MYNLGSAAPASTLLKPTVWEGVQGLLDGGLVSLELVKKVDMINPALCRLIRQYLGRHVSDQLLIVLQHLLELSKAAYVPAVLPAVSLLRQNKAASRRVVVQREQQGCPAEQWACDEAYLRTGVWSGGQGDWAPSVLGGSDVKRALQSYRADATSFGTESSCTKHKRSTAKLIPGGLFFWCTECGICPMFGLMADAESPKTVFDLLMTRAEHAPSRVCYDDGCRLVQYALNREPEHFRATQFLIDNPHFKTHANCANEYDTKHYPKYFDNSPLAEQKNSILRTLETSSAYMIQMTFLLYARHFCHKLNTIQREKPRGSCFWC